MKPAFQNAKTKAKETLVRGIPAVPCIGWRSTAAASALQRGAQAG